MVKTRNPSRRPKDDRLPPKLNDGFTNDMPQINLCFEAKVERDNDATMILNPLNKRNTGKLTAHTWRLKPMKLDTRIIYETEPYEMPDSSV